LLIGVSCGTAEAVPQRKRQLSHRLVAPLGDKVPVDSPGSLRHRQLFSDCSRQEHGLSGRFIWKVYLEGLSGRFIWKVYLEGLSGRFIWKVYLEDLTGEVFGRSFTKQKL
jgi:hypothetical protein